VTGVRLVAAAPTPALRQARFGGDQDLDEGGANAALARRGTLPATGTWVSAPSRAAVQTAAALGGDPTTEPALADVDYGSWTGFALDEIDRAEPDALHAWLTDPATAPGGGESLAAVRTRAGAWLDAHAGADLTAVAHATVVRAALAHALRLPADGIWQLDVAPLAVLRLTHRAGRWHLHL